jgi:hypothetical protein
MSELMKLVEQMTPDQLVMAFWGCIILVAAIMASLIAWRVGSTVKRNDEYDSSWRDDRW